MIKRTFYEHCSQSWVLMWILPFAFIFALLSANKINTLLNNTFNFYLLHVCMPYGFESISSEPFHHLLNGELCEGQKITFCRRRSGLGACAAASPASLGFFHQRFSLFLLVVWRGLFCSPRERLKQPDLFFPQQKSLSVNKQLRTEPSTSGVDAPLNADNRKKQSGEKFSLLSAPTLTH